MCFESISTQRKDRRLCLISHPPIWIVDWICTEKQMMMQKTGKWSSFKKQERERNSPIINVETSRFLGKTLWSNSTNAEDELDEVWRTVVAKSVDLAVVQPVPWSGWSTLKPRMHAKHGVLVSCRASVINSSTCDMRCEITRFNVRNSRLTWWTCGLLARLPAVVCIGQ